MSRRRRVITVVVTAAVAVALAACSTPPPPPAHPPLSGAFTPRRLDGPLPDPAEPATSPAATVPPAGRVIPVGKVPEGIVADPTTRRVAVGVREPNALVLIDADTGAVAGRVPLPGSLRHLQLVRDGGPLLVPDESSNALLEVALPSGRVLAQVPTGTLPHDANAAANGTIFVANEGGGSVVAVRDGAVVATFTDVTQPAGVAHVGDTVGLLDVRENTLTFYDAATLRPLTELAAGDGPTHVVADSHGRMVVVDTRGGALLVYTPPPQAGQVARLALPGGPYGVTYDPVRDRVWVTLTATDQVVGFDMAQPQPREVARLPTVSQPNTVAVDPTTGRLFVTGTNDGTVEIIDPLSGAAYHFPVLGLVVVVVLGCTVLLGTTLGGRYRVAPPVLLICFGGLLGLIPGLSAVELEPDVVLLLFLPPILYWESLNTSLREIRANLRVIVLSSVVLVIVTMAAVAYAGRALGMDPRAAWVLGAVLAPTDAAAVSGLAKRLPRRTLTTLRAESLINDGTALVLYAVAISVALGDTAPGPVTIGVEFVGSYVGGIVAGLLVGGAVVAIRRRLDDPLREGTLSVLTPFLAFLLAELLHSSGVVAVVVSGLVLAYAGPRVIRARSRTQAFAFWDQATFMINGGLFVLVGLQFRRVVANLDGTTVARALGVAVGITAVVIGTRLLWIHTTPYVIRAIDRRAVQRTRRVGWRQRMVSGWSGFRGAVSLATALAVPATLGAGAPFPDRDLIVFVAAVVILLTILVQGTTLPLVVAWARLPEDTGRAEELARARTKAADAALAALPRLAADSGVNDKHLRRLQKEYEEFREITIDAEGDSAAERNRDRDLRLAVLAEKRATVTAMRDANEIDDIVLRELQAAMDVEEIRLLGPVTPD